jgi:NAD(P)-dependent dehydrogenase (short-subunit alcohol dehydrogenase family)
MENIDLTGKVALVTGASSGIGRDTALLLASAGASVVVASRRSALNDEVVAAIKAAGGKALAVTTDVSKEADIARAVAETVKAFGRLDIAFNNAGVEEQPGALTDKTEELYHHVFDINVKGVLLSLKHEIPAMLKNGGGSIINTSSIAGHIGMAGVPVYIASKHAVEGLTKSVALEVAKQGIRVNAVAPAAIETPMYDRFVGDNKQAQDYMKSLHPIGRTGQPREIADVVLWLASNRSSFVTGQSIVVDGGFTAQ